MKDQISLPTIPYKIEWVTNPVFWKVGLEEGFTIQSGENSDWFTDPVGFDPKDDAPCAIFTPTDMNFLFSAKLTVDFQSLYDAGGLLIQGSKNLWGKVCFEFSYQRKPTVVSVVTRRISDDCISTDFDGQDIYLRIAHTPRVTAFHYSKDGHFWHLVRYFTLGELDTVRAGFLSQSPTGHGCLVRFSDIIYSTRVLNNYRNGE